MVNRRGQKVVIFIPNLIEQKVNCTSLGTSSQTIITNIPEDVLDSISDNNQLIDFVASDKIANNNTSSNDNDALSNTTSTDIHDMLTQERKKQKEYIY